MTTVFRWRRDARPRLLLAGRFPLPATDDWVRHVHEGFDALHLHEYEARWRIGSEEQLLSPGAVTLSPRGVLTEYQLDKPGYHLCIHFDVAYSRGPRLDLPARVPLGARRHSVTDHVLDIVRLFTRGSEKGASELWHDAAALSLQALLVELSLGSADPEPSPPAVERAARIIDQRFAEALTMADIAREVGVSQNYLAAKFVQTLGVTMPHYRLERRIEAARYLVIGTDLAIKTIGEQVGIADPQYFSKQFHRLTGTSPTALRGRR